jgi:pimeloyl-ACP methyl ester carboxylesterase
MAKAIRSGIMALQQKHFTNADCDVNYWCRLGNGTESVVFFHGVGCNHEMFAPQLPLFDGSYNLLLWDARGRKQSIILKGVRVTKRNDF